RRAPWLRGRCRATQGQDPATRPGRSLNRGGSCSERHLWFHVADRGDAELLTVIVDEAGHRQLYPNASDTPTPPSRCRSPPMPSKATTPPPPKPPPPPSSVTHDHRPTSQPTPQHALSPFPWCQDGVRRIRNAPDTGRGR